MKRYFIPAIASMAMILSFTPSADAQWFRIFRRQCCPPPPCCPCPTVACLPATQPAPSEVPFRSPSGRVYRIIDTQERGEFFEPKPAPSTVAGARSIEDFAGNDRKAAKISIANAPIQSYPNVRKLLDTLVGDSNMMALGISKDSNSNRVAQENRNVAVHGFIYAVKFEDDHDFHAILGMSPGTTPAFLNVEISGLPPSGPHRAKLKEARTTFKNFFSEQGNQFSSSYKKFDPPIPVRLEGSLFFDVDHPAGVVGPQGMRPQTAWEIHPVTKIEFEIDP